jgi:hypothetical protein
MKKSAERRRVPLVMTNSSTIYQDWIFDMCIGLEDCPGGAANRRE